MRYEKYAVVVELVYATDLKSVGSNPMRVQVPPTAHKNYGIKFIKEIFHEIVT